VNVSAGYMAGLRLTVDLVGRYKAFRPAFRFPDPEILFIAPLDEVAKYLVRNKAARELVSELLEESKRRKLESPTVLMLRAALDQHDITFTSVEFADLGIPGRMVNLRRPGSGPPS
jgi:hypothetical protein